MVYDNDNDDDEEGGTKRNDEGASNEGVVRDLE